MREKFYLAGGKQLHLALKGTTMKVVVVNFNVDNHNPTVRLWPLIFLGACDAHFFGPGFVCADVLRKGLAQFLKNLGGCDALVLGEHIFMSNIEGANLNTLAGQYKKFYITPFDIDAALKSVGALFEECLKFDGPLIFSHFEMDSYNMRETHANLLRQHQPYVLGWGLDFILSMKEHEARGHFDAYRERPEMTRFNDNWWNTLKHLEQKVISMPAMVCDDEFCLTPLAARRHKWTVPGATYVARIRMRHALDQCGIRRPERKWIRMVDYANRFHLQYLNNKLGVTVYNDVFRSHLRSSQLAFTCGGVLRAPIRKYFEIPSHGAVLACEPCVGFSELGFREGKNSIIVDPGHIDSNGDVDYSPAELELIAIQGRRLAWENHSLGARIRQMRRCLDAIVTRRFKGTYWANGMLNLKD